MSSKRSKLTAGKARARITSLEDSVASRVQRLEQLNARIARSSSPEERLFAAKQRLERRIEIETGQIEKLRNLLGDRIDDSGQESEEFFGSEELEDIHRSFEEVRQDLSQVKMRLESTEHPRDLPNRLSSFEQRMSRREEADSDLFAQILNLQTGLDQERQTVRRLSRRVREQDQNIDALREAVEDSVVATVDLAERLEELEENLSDNPRTSVSTSQLVELKEEIDYQIKNLAAKTQEMQQLVSNSGDEVQTRAPETGVDMALLFEALEEFDERLEALENGFLTSSYDNTELARGPELIPTADPAESNDSTWKPAVFSSQGAQGRLVAKFSVGVPLPKK